MTANRGEYDTGPGERAEVVRRAQRGDRQAWSDLVAEHLDRVYEHCRVTLGDVHDAEDATQRTFEHAQPTIGQLRDPSCFRSWLLTIATRQAWEVSKESSAFRGRRKSKDLEEDFFDRADSVPPVDEQVHRQQLGAMVWDAIDSLGERDRELLSLNLRNGLRGKELADAVAEEDRSKLDRQLNRAKGYFGKSFVALVLVRHGSRECPTLRKITESETAASLRVLPSSLSKKISRHLNGCDVCRREADLRVSPEALFAAAPLLAAPGWLRARLVNAARGLPPGDDDHRPRPGQDPRRPTGGAVQARAEAGPGRPRRVSAVAPAVVVVILLLLAGVTLPFLDGAQGATTVRGQAPSPTATVPADHPESTESGTQPSIPPGPRTGITSGPAEPPPDQPAPTQPAPTQAAPRRSAPPASPFGPNAPGLDGRPPSPGVSAPGGNSPGLSTDGPASTAGPLVTPARLELDPQVIDLGDVEDAAAVTVTNHGGLAAAVADPDDLPDWLLITPPLEPLRPNSTGQILVAVNRDVLPGGLFEHRVEFTPDDGGTPATLTVRGNVPPPPAPTLSSPTDGDTRYRTDIKLTWEDVPNAARYLVRTFRKDSTGTWQPVSSDSTDVSYFDRVFEYGDWQWHVTAVSAAGTAGPASPTFTLMVKPFVR